MACTLDDAKFSVTVGCVDQHPSLFDRHHRVVGTMNDHQVARRNGGDGSKRIKGEYLVDELLG